AMVINGYSATQKADFYAQASEGDLFFLLGSAGYFEISAFKQSAARRIEARRGMKVELLVG
ncbi:MAG TPA: SAM hydroxide adenosyltransferase, partial [Acidobacteriota bacterium]|nr:SAM hydroxide adenosyltransferase [Acidobacteriota bacterium]